MTLATSLDNKTDSNEVIYKKNSDGGRVEKHRTNGADMFLTAIVTEKDETPPDVALCATGEEVCGVIIGTYTPYEIDLTKDSDDTLADNKDVQVYKPQNKDQLYGTVKTNTTITINTWVDVDGGFLIAGSRAAHIGTAKEAVIGASSVEAIILYEWDYGG